MKFIIKINLIITTINKIINIIKLFYLGFIFDLIKIKL